MTLDHDQLKYRLDHARANYWILTFICGILLAFTISKIIQAEFDSVAAVCGSLLVFVGYFSLKLAAEVKKLKAMRD